MGKGGKPKVCQHSISWHLGTKTKEGKGFKKGMGGKLCWMLRGWVGWRQRSCWLWQEESKRHLKINTCKTVLELFPLKVLLAPLVENILSISSAQNPGVTPDSSLCFGSYLQPTSKFCWLNFKIYPKSDMSHHSSHYQTSTSLTQIITIAS